MKTKNFQVLIFVFLVFFFFVFYTLQPENVLCVTRTGNRIKLIDFGFARRFVPGQKMQILFGTPEFVAPEVVNYEDAGFGTDLWAVGVICYIL